MSFVLGNLVEVTKIQEYVLGVDNSSCIEINNFYKKASNLLSDCCFLEYLMI